MTTSLLPATDLLLAYSAYLIGTASPGPSNLAIMSIAASHGRRPAFAFAAGVVSGSFFWALLASLGLSALLVAYSGFLVAVKLVGGAYLLWLAFKAGRSALTPRAAAISAAAASASAGRYYIRGALLHLTNPKAVLVWLAVVSLAAPAHAAPERIAQIVGGCLMIGVTVFGTYATVFSTATARRLYARLRRWLDGCVALAFGLAGMKLLTGRP